MTVQKKILDLTGSQYLVQKVKSAINDVDSSLSTHIADTDIHVTTADKNRWNNQTYVFRYSSTALVASSTNSNSLLDNADNLKVGDKVIDSSGVLFSITAIDTQNSTFTIGTALIDLAQDSNVVHKSGEESVIGSKRFGVVQNFTGYPTIRLYSTSDDITVVPPYAQQQDIRFTDKNNNIIAYFIFQHRTDINEPFRTCWRQVKMDGTQGYYSINFNNLGTFYPENNNAIDLGGQGNRWKSVYATNYYYGPNNVEFSTKFVTTDTNQTISGDKTWTGANAFKQNITYERTNFYHQNVSPCYILKDTELEKGSLASTHTAYPGLWQDKNSNVLGYVRFVEYSSGWQRAEFRVSNLIKNGTLDPTGSEVNCTVYLELQPSGEKSLIPEQNNDINLGTSTNKWKTLNGVEPSSLSMPDLSNSIDISSYITDLTGSPNAYSPPANGYIVLRSTTANILGIVENTTGMGSYSRGSNQVLAVNLPVVKNSSITIYAVCSSLSQAKFIPCLGNV